MGLVKKTEPIRHMGDCGRAKERGEAPMERACTSLDPQEPGHDSGKPGRKERHHCRPVWKVHIPCLEVAVVFIPDLSDMPIEQSAGKALNGAGQPTEQILGVLHDQAFTLRRSGHRGSLPRGELGALRCPPPFECD